MKEWLIVVLKVGVFMYGKDALLAYSSKDEGWLPIVLSW
jgi:hypothetical protein